MKLISKQQRMRYVYISIELISAIPPMMNIPEGLWQSLKRKSVISGKTFPHGSNIVMIMYREGGHRLSGAVHLEELPDNVREVIESGQTWKEE